ncbi:aspartate/glutamate racemase family protein [Tateyamaria pelophila]|uniref:aspartate/glutamate racemase family protein n=1 Tax=Tateyamaria pelophila TaxID=328415 RepID=UPI001CBC9DAF|nr:aspartate/glutamate racemase family protein [Tateyamaria pelophila]
MAAGQHPGVGPRMRPALTVLQLDTHFPRVPGDVASADTYLAEVEFIRIPAASVGRIVTGDPGSVNITPFEEAVRRARGDVITTSCGFLAHWQTQLQAQTTRPVVASALMALPGLACLGGAIAVLTFDANKLIAGHGDILRGHETQVFGLNADMHLKQVIELDACALDQRRAAEEIAALVKDHVAAKCQTLLLECTNLPPYKAAIRDMFTGQIVDILTEIEALRPGTVRPVFL